jgi:predicted nucleic acid-binding protein
VTYLLDTNVVAELRRQRPNAGVLAWFDSIRRPQDLYLSVLTIAEIRRGIERIGARDPQQRAALEEWLTTLLGEHAVSTVSVDPEIADRWARVEPTYGAPNVDGLLAATALVRDWTLVTGNVAAFERTGVKLLNPFT